MDEPETRYAKTSDGVYIAYQVVGNGPVDLVFIYEWIWNLELQWENPLCARFLERLSSFSRLLLFDKRGSGLSDRTVDLDLFTLEVRIDDVRAVMEAAASEQAVLFGYGEDGAPLAAVFAAANPERTRALILYETHSLGGDGFGWLARPFPEMRARSRPKDHGSDQTDPYTAERESPHHVCPPMDAEVDPARTDR
jgi:pimeloyl-ACP methyl ester carboxylesterase